MQTVLIVFHLMVVIALVATVLLQRSEGGALGVGGGGGFMTGRGQANALTRATAILGTLFFVTSLGLTLLAPLQPRAEVDHRRGPGRAAHPAERAGRARRFDAARSAAPDGAAAERVRRGDPGSAADPCGSGATRGAEVAVTDGAVLRSRCTEDRCEAGPVPAFACADAGPGEALASATPFEPAWRKSRSAIATRSIGCRTRS